VTLIHASTTATPPPRACVSTAARAVLERLAIETELRLEQAHRLRMPYGETTITDHNLLEIGLAALPDVVVRHVPPLGESKFGYDWEWWVRIGSQPWVGMFLQAKKLHSGKEKYRRLTHKVKGTNEAQVDLLWRHAKSFGGIPLYNLYNGPRSPIAAWNCGETRDDRQLGCSIVPLHLVKSFINFRRPRASKGTKPSSDFQRLHENEIAIPWRCVVCASRISADQGFFASLADPRIELRGYPELPFYVQQLINNERSDAQLQEYPGTTGMFPRRIAVISIEPPIAVAPLALPAPNGDNLGSLMDEGKIRWPKHKVFA